MGTPASEAEDPKFRVSALSGGWGRNDSVGLVDKISGQEKSLRIGDKTADGWQLVSVDVDQETATFNKNGRPFIARLEQGNPSLSPQVSPRSRTEIASEKEPLPLPLNAVEQPDLSQPFSNRTFRVADGEEFSLRSVERSREVVEIRTGSERYAIRRTIAETILRLDNVTPDDRLWMMVSYPGLVQLLPGDDPASLSDEAEKQLTEMLVPPTNKPPIEELNRLLENFTEEPPPNP